MQSRPKKNNTWIWYFVILFVLTVAASASLVIYNLRQQLNLEQLGAAKALWDERGPRNYDMRYTKQLAALEAFEVKVRHGVVVEARRNGEPLEERLLRYHSMPALFSDIKRFLEIDAEPGRPRTFTVASFDEQDGHVRRYIRRVGGTTERVEIVVQKFEPLPADGASEKR